MTRRAEELATEMHQLNVDYETALRSGDHARADALFDRWRQLDEEAEQQHDKRQPPAETPMPEPDVKVHHSNGCPLCGDTGPHTHPSDEWEAARDAAGPYTPPAPPPVDLDKVGKAVEDYQDAKKKAAEAVIGAVTAPAAAGGATTGGTGMSQQEVIAALQQIKESLEGARGPGQQAQTAIEEQEAAAQQVLDHGGPGATELQQAVAQAKQAFEQANQTVEQVGQACEDAIARASAV